MLLLWLLLMFRMFSGGWSQMLSSKEAAVMTPINPINAARMVFLIDNFIAIQGFERVQNPGM